MRILVVDDMAFMRDAIKSSLSQTEGYKVVGEAENGLEAIEKFKKLKPDLVTMDINMPKMDGLSSLDKIFEIDNKAKVIMVSDLGEYKNLALALQKGAAGFIVKPINPQKLKESINSLCS